MKLLTRITGPETDQLPPKCVTLASAKLVFLKIFLLLNGSNM